MSDNAEQPDDRPPAIKLPVKRTRFKAPPTTADDRRACRMLCSKAISIALHVEAARRELSISALLLDACRSRYPSIAGALDAEAKRRAA